MVRSTAAWLATRERCSATARLVSRKSADIASGSNFGRKFGK